MGIFSRTRDIIAANVTDLLDKAEDPAKMIRMIILEMEETLVEVRATAARNIADQKEMRRAIGKLEVAQASWTEKAALALSKDREDLAKAALVEKQKAADMAAQLEGEIAERRFGVVGHFVVCHGGNHAPRGCADHRGCCARALQRLQRRWFAGTGQGIPDTWPRRFARGPAGGPLEGASGVVRGWSSCDSGGG